MDTHKSELIKNSIFNIINNEIELEELRTLLIKFTEYQSEKGFTFGELLVLHYEMFNGTETNDIYTVAAAIELMILSSDILDDFEDGDFQNQPWSTEFALSLNATTALQFLSLKVMNRIKFKNKERALSILSTFAIKSINGQHKDLLNICKSEADYIDMTLEKSGSLVALSCAIGATLATEDPPLEMIETYGKYIGLIGQINNDLQDIKLWNSKNDLLNKKYSLPIIYLLNNKEEKYHLIKSYYDGNIDESDILNYKDFISKEFIESGAIIYTDVIKKIYRNKILNILKEFNTNQNNIDLLLKYI